MVEGEKILHAERDTFDAMVAQLEALTAELTRLSQTPQGEGVVTSAQSITELEGQIASLSRSIQNYWL